MLIKPKNTRNKKKILKTARETRQITYKGRIIITDLQATIKARREYTNIFSVPRENWFKMVD